MRRDAARRFPFWDGSDSHAPRGRRFAGRANGSLLQLIGVSGSVAGGESAAGIPLFALPASHLHPFRVAGKAGADQPRGVEMKTAQRPASVVLGPSSPHGSHPVLHGYVSEPAQKPMELRPHAGAGTSTTLRAVILGGKALAPQAGASSVILAPTGLAGAAVPKAHEIPSVELSGEKVAGDPRGE